MTHPPATWGGWRGMALMLVTPPGCFLAPVVVYYAAMNAFHRLMRWS